MNYVVLTEDIDNNESLIVGEDTDNDKKIIKYSYLKILLQPKSTQHSLALLTLLN